jgi:hypothetical protein
MSRKTASPQARRHAALTIASRTLAGGVGGYAVAALATALLPRLLPMARSEAVMAATLLSFALYAGVVLWAFAARSSRRLWLGLGGVAALLAAGNALAIALGGRL